MHNREKPIDKALENNYSSNSHNNYTTTIVYRNFQAYSQNCGGCGSRRSCHSHNGYPKRRISNATPARKANNTNKSNPSDHSKNTYFNYNKIGY